MTTKSLVRTVLGTAAATMVATTAALSGGAGAATAGAPPPASVAPSGQTPFGGTTQSVCSSAPVGYSSCLARVVNPADEQSYLSTFTRSARFGHNSGPQRGGSSGVTVSGLSPSNIDSVYGFTASSTAGTGTTIAIVDAYDDPTAAADLSTFSSQWGLPACTTANGCFTKVNEFGGTTLPNANKSWALEISLDIEWAHAMAPGADILLVEANSNSDSDLFTADHYAGQHASYVSNSWGGPEYAGENANDVDLTGASYFAATGDAASAVYYPATSPDVVAVGGTSLKFNSNGSLASESAWSSGGGGCSADELASSAQLAEDAQAGCGLKRAVPDVSLDADPNSGVAVYDSTAYDGSSGWWTVGGTSVSTPIWAAESAATGYAPTQQNLYSASPTPRLKDITSGSNGHPTLVGFDLATGLGSWDNGVPPAPSSLTATSSAGAITLQWGSAAGATSYEIYRGTSATSISTTPYVTVTGTTYRDTGVTSGRTYYYEVEGLDSPGQGIPSNQASAAPGVSSGGGAPGAPTLGGMLSGNKAVLTWGSVTGATSYEVFWGTSASSLSLLTTTKKTTDSDKVPAGSTYYFEVEAVNSSGVAGAPSNAVSVTHPKK